MKKIKRLTILATILSFVCLSSPSFSQVYPGDVNNNGEVNNMDFLVLTTALGQTGPARNYTGTDWIGWDYNEWGETLLDSDLDLAMADSNGDGSIDEDDIDVIHLNKHFTNPPVQPFAFSEGSPGQAPSLQIEFIYTPVENGLAVEIIIRNEGPMPSFKGMVFSLGLGDLIDDLSQISNSFDESWANGDAAAYEYFEVDQENQQLDFAIAKSSFSDPAETEGILAKTEIIIVDDAIALRTQNPFIEVKNSYALSDDNAEIPVINSSKELLIVSDDNTSGSNSNGNGNAYGNGNGNGNAYGNTSNNVQPEQITLFPNPAVNHVNFNLNGNAVYKIIVRDQDGNVIGTLNGNANGFNLAGQLPGYYHFSFYDVLGTELTTRTVSHF